MAPTSPMALMVSAALMVIVPPMVSMVVVLKYYGA